MLCQCHVCVVFVELQVSWHCLKMTRLPLFKSICFCYYYLIESGGRICCAGLIPEPMS